MAPQLGLEIAEIALDRGDQTLEPFGPCEIGRELNFCPNLKKIIVTGNPKNFFATEL